jgi:predicted ArsR family transcriptional regulator
MQAAAFPPQFQAANVYHEKSVDECAQIVGISPATVKTHMF